MPNRSKALEGVPNSIDPELQARADATCASVQGLLAMIRRIDNTLMFIDRTLRVSQPPIARKFGVRFWTPTHDAPRVPVLIVWRRVKNNRWRAQRVQRLTSQSVNRTGHAALCADNTLRLAAAADRLIRLRADLVLRLQRLRHGADRARNRYALIDQAEATAITEHADVVKRLEAAGYSVDQRTKGLPDQFIT
ncbi:MAG TPA: hypothetical protein VF292_03095 [Rhodanobacteraceae bacterium]